VFLSKVTTTKAVMMGRIMVSFFFLRQDTELTYFILFSGDHNKGGKDHDHDGKGDHGKGDHNDHDGKGDHGKGGEKGHGHYPRGGEYGNGKGNNKGWFVSEKL
jgi:hypothetical protein